MNITSWRRWLLVSILAAGALIRFYHLGHESFWMDEDITRQIAHFSFANVLENSLEDVHPPVYPILTYAWVRLVGDTEAQLRFPSLVFGVLALVWMYHLGKLLFDARTGHLAAAFMAFSVFHVTYSQEARSYSLMVFFALGSIYFFAKILKTERHNARDDLFYCLFSLCLLYTHTYGVFTILTQNLFFFIALAIRRPVAVNQRNRWIFLQSTLFLLYIPWIFITRHQADMIGHNYWIRQPNLTFLKYTFVLYAGGSTKLLALYLALALFPLALALKERCTNYLPVFLSCALCVAVTVGIPYVVSVFWSPIFDPRYTIVASLPFYLLAAKGVCDMPSRVLRRGLAVLVLAFSLNGLMYYFTHVQKEQWRDAAQFVDTHSESGDLVVFHRDLSTVFNYYSKKAGLEKVVYPKQVNLGRFVPLETSIQVTPERIGELESLIHGRHRVWFVLSHGRDPDRLINRTLEAHFKKIYHEKYLAIEVILFSNEAS